MQRLEGPRTLCERFQRAVHEHGPRKAQVWKDGSTGEWTSRTYAQFGRAVQEVALGLVSMEVEPGDRVGIVADNGPEWAVADFAILHAGAVTVPVYPTLNPPQMAYILDDAEVGVVFVDGDELYDKMQAAAKDAPGVHTIVRMDDDVKAALHGAAAGTVDSVFPIRNLYEEGQSLVGEGTGEESFVERWGAVEEDDLATFIYTSGTTGRPKGVMLTHGNIAQNINSFTSIIQFVENERYLSFLPLSHSYERTVGHFAAFGDGLQIWYAQSIDTIGEDLKACRPELMIAVPRLWEKMGQRIEAALAEATGLKRRLVDWAMDVGEQVLDERMENKTKEVSGLLALKQGIAERLVLRKIRAEAGLDELRMANSGAAALDPEVARLFWSLGVEIYEGYGLTETAPVLTANRPDDFKLGTVGKAIPGVELRIDEADWDGAEGEGEILARGPNVMEGYWQLPEVTDETIQDGWLHTGDVGTLDDEGFLTITDRKKELFKTAYGKYVAPEHVGRLIKRDELVDQVLVVGAERKYVVALVSPDFETLEPWAKENDVSFKDRAELVEHEDVQAYFEDVVEEANEELARHEQVKRFAVVPDAWEIGEEMTPTLKIKRRVVEETYADTIEDLYP